MLKRIEVENAFKNAAKDGGPFGLKEEVVPLSYCLEITQQYFREEIDERDIKIAQLEAKCGIYETVISKSDFDIIIKKPEEVNPDAEKELAHRVVC